MLWFIKMICVIKCLKESVESFKQGTFNIIKINNYKHHTEIIAVIDYSYSVSLSLKFDCPFSIYYENIGSTVTVLYDKKDGLHRKTTAEKSKPINWKLQFQRHQVSKLLKITG